MSLIQKLVSEWGQEQLLEQTAEAQKTLEEQLQSLDRDTAGGVCEYLRRARVLLERSQQNVNPYEGCAVSVPEGEQFDPEQDVEKFIEYETYGASEISGLCFCLVAGGLGERLGYGDIKISLPVDSLTGKCYMQWYAEWILALQAKAISAVRLPLAIMTSEDTHLKTLALFESHDFFGLHRDQVTFLKQAKVPALIDNAARMAVEFSAAGPQITTKPHGHGDVHTLLHQSGLAAKWLGEGRKWLLFFQDTNALSWRSLLVLLGVAKKRDFAMTSLAVPRVPGEATGAIVTLTSPTLTTTSSIEYNVLSSLAVDDKPSSSTGAPVSKFPGNTNTLLLALSPYAAVLAKSQGVMPEFVNPKYADAEKTKFKSATRLECLMQDISFLLSESGGVCGFAALPKYVAFSVVKNSNVEAAAKIKANLPADCAFSGEVELADSCSRLLRLAGSLAGKPVLVDAPQVETYNGVTLSVGPRVHLAPAFGVGLQDLADSLRTLPDAELVLKLHKGVVFEKPGVALKRNITVEVVDEKSDDPAIPLATKIRGFRL